MSAAQIPDDILTTTFAPLEALAYTVTTCTGPALPSAQDIRFAARALVYLDYGRADEFEAKYGRRPIAVLSDVILKLERAIP